MLLAILLAAVAGGQLAVSMEPAHPRMGQRATVYLTGQVGDHGHLYVFRNRTRRCADTARGERRIGALAGSWAINQPFEKRVRFAARPGWVCAYLYAITCDAAGQNCAPATGLPPDAGFASVRVKPRPASH